MQETQIKQEFQVDVVPRGTPSPLTQSIIGGTALVNPIFVDQAQMEEAVKNNRIERDSWKHGFHVICEKESGMTEDDRKVIYMHQKQKRVNKLNFEGHRLDKGCSDGDKGKQRLVM